MVLDSSAVIAILLRESPWQELLARIAAAESVVVGAPTLAECGLLLSAKLKRGAEAILLRFLQEADVEVVPFGPLHWRAAVEAYRRFGRKNHRAALNFGDCLSYATARVSAQPLLYTGDDFAKTDIPRA